MKRDNSISQIEERGSNWDVIVIGGGATGLGTAVEAASRGYKTLLLEQHDFAKGTSSRSTKLIHGGVRYLQQGNISLVLEALHERGLLIKNAPHLVHNQSFIVPNYEWWSGPFYGVGLKVYDLMAGRLGLGPSKILSREETLKQIPTLEPENLRGGVIYYDGQFDDARLAINLAQTLSDLGGTAINYCKVTGFSKKMGMIRSIIAVDLEKEKEYELNGEVVINATGIFTDDIIKMDDSSANNILTYSQGAHLVLEKEFLPGETAIMVPHTSDGRVLFAVPWHEKVIVGTTDTPIPHPTLEPTPLESEINFILTNAAQYLTKDPTKKDILSIFAGIRPLVNLGDEKNTARISRDHHLLVSESGLVTITGGKWTTYRKMAEDTINQAALVGCLEEHSSISRDLHIHGWSEEQNEDDFLHYYGSDTSIIKEIIRGDPQAGERIHPRLPYIKASIIWAVREEMARTVEDVLSRRTRALLLDARASMESTEVVVEIMARELQKDKSWKKQQIKIFLKLAEKYLA
jgi:glycerol-3-phosphate dehydrogenase